MNEPIETGGFVYPTIDEGVVDFGITRRDWLAGMAMSGLVASSNSSKDSMHPTTALEVARSAYHIADLMIRTSMEQEATTSHPAPVPVRVPEPV